MNTSSLDDSLRVELTWVKVRSFEFFFINVCIHFHMKQRPIFNERHMKSMVTNFTYIHHASENGFEKKNHFSIKYPLLIFYESEKTSISRFLKQTPRKIFSNIKSMDVVDWLVLPFFYNGVNPFPPMLF